MKRRALLLATSALLATPWVSFAQQAQETIPRVGFLISETVPGSASRIEALRAGLRDRDYVEGKNIVIEIQAADGNYERLPDLAIALVRLKADVIVAFGSKATSAAKRQGLAKIEVGVAGH